MRTENRKYTKKDKHKVIRHHLAGKTDVEIIDITGFNPNFVGKTTRQYWKDKMKEKHFELI